MKLVATTGDFIIPVKNTSIPRMTRQWVKDYTVINNVETPLWYSVRGRYYYFIVNGKWYKCLLALNKNTLEWYKFTLEE